MGISIRKAAETALKQCMKLRKGETLLVITDRKRKRIGEALFDSGIEAGARAVLAEIPEGKMHGEEPPESLAGMMKSFDVIMAPTTKSLSHTDAVRNASKSARIATLPGITEEVFRRGMSADYNSIAERTNRIKKALNRCRKIRVVTAKGTDITMGMGRKMDTRKKEGMIHRKGQVNNLPAGEAGFAPAQGTAEGVFVVDASFGGVGKVDRQVRIRVKKGCAVRIEGGKAAEKLRKMLRRCGKEAYNIAELGIGTNNKARISGVVLEDEKVMGTAHIALGNSRGMGGSVYAPCHLDGVFRNPTIYADSRKIMHKGKLLI